ncbi:MAG TPA: hypothetical protein VMF50_15875 [Candidatus Binataceae bacterium]|nr:hypothetical protein [Candidatus Binataceae bacterium]
MRQTKTRVIVDGAIAGLLGGLVIAAWFFIFDAVHGHPLETPAILAAVLLHGVRQPVMTGAAWTLVIEYSIVHFLAFAAVGIVGALLLDAAEDHPEMFGTLLIFTIGFEVFFIAVIVMLGPAAQAAVSIWKGMSGNLLATAAMLSFFFWRQPILARNLLGPWVAIVREGIIAGILGGVIVAAWFLIYDAAIGHPFRTPALLGAIIFNGMREPKGFAVSAALVLGYTVLHFFAFILFGIAASILMAASEHEPLLALGTLVLFFCFELCFVAFVTFLDQTAVQEIGWWNIIGGNVTALAAIIAFYEIRHPRVVPRISGRWAAVQGGSDQGQRVHVGSHR